MMEIRLKKHTKQLFNYSPPETCNPSREQSRIPKFNDLADYKIASLCVKNYRKTIWFQPVSRSCLKLKCMNLDDHLC